MTDIIPDPDRRRVLVTDDEPNMLDAYRRVLESLTASPARAASQLDTLSLELFGTSELVQDEALLEDVVFERQGDRAVKAVEQSIADGRPFAIVFLDMRMPPGIDGMETTRRIRALDSAVNIVIVTGFSDHHPAAISRAAGSPDKLFYLVKPFDGTEVQQLTMALANRWSVDMRRAAELAARVTELEALNARLRTSEAHAIEMARQDALTGLPNRKGLAEHAAGDRIRAISALYLDLDRFKGVNDTMGHNAGDELIVEFARRARAATGEDGFIARWGGDEFVILVSDSSRVGRLCDRLLEACRQPFQLLGRSVEASVSIGVANADASAFNFLELMHRADIALYAAKAAGGGRAMLYDASMEPDSLPDKQAAFELRRAIDEGELYLDYQALVSADGLTITAVEALLRWSHPTRGRIPPDGFIPMAEKSEIIRDLGDWVLRQAFSDARAWPDIITAINLSPAQFRYPGLVDRIVSLAAAIGVDPRKIEFEITEAILIAELDQTSDDIVRLRDAGFRVALDDFGVGNSSLDYLSRIPFDKLKIDRSFVHRLGTTPQAAEVLRSIVHLASSLGLSITAEGVEDEVQHAFLREAGCDQMQGFLFHRPVSRERILELRNTAPLRAHR